jgi:recombination protein RecT
MANKIVPVKNLFDAPSVREKFEEVFGEKGKENQPKTTAFILSAINVITNNELLAKADTNSVLFATATAATVDLPINQNLGFAYIVPYYDKKSKNYKAQFQMGYKGFIQLAQRSGQFKTISATPIREGQIVSNDPLTGYKFDFEAEEVGDIVGYAGYIELINGFSKTMYMTIEDLKAHGTKYSQSFRKGYGLWEDNFDAMATKTVLKLLLSKYAPMSIQMQTAVLADQAVEENHYPDNVKPDLEEVQREKEIERLDIWVDKAETKEKLEEAEKAILETEDKNLIAKFEAKLNKFNETKKDEK